MPIEIILGETHRESNGLAMSTRNKYLSPEQVEKAAIIFAALSKGAPHTCQFFGRAFCPKWLPRLGKFSV